jgi:hypothetical protein
MATMSDQSRPAGICANCYAVYRAKRPRPQALYCWHLGAAARQTPKGWLVLEAVGDHELAEMRAKGML